MHTPLASVLVALIASLAIASTGCSDENKTPTSAPDAGTSDDDDDDDHDDCSTWTDCAKRNAGECCILGKNARCASREDALASGSLTSCK